MDTIKKEKPLSSGFNEIIGYQIANIYGLLTPNIDVKVLENKCEISSLDLNVTGNFISPCYHKDLVSLYDIWDYLEDKGLYRDDLMQDFIKLYTMDIIFGNPDRSMDNWGFLKVNNIPYLVIFDNELLFSKCHPNYITSDLDETRFGKSTQEDDLDFIISQKLADIENFFASSSEEYIDLFINMFYKIDYSIFKSILDNAENEMGIKDSEREEKEDYFKRTYDGIILIIKKYRPVRSRLNAA